MAKKDTVKKTTSKVKKVETPIKEDVVEIVKEENKVEIEVEEISTVEDMKVEEVSIEKEEIKEEEVVEEKEPIKDENKPQPIIKRIFGYIWNGQIFG